MIGFRLRLDDTVEAMLEVFTGAGWVFASAGSRSSTAWRPGGLIEHFGRRGIADLGPDAANGLFRVVCARYRLRSTIVVSNLPFKHWAEFLPSPAQAVAIADRLVDDATILRVSGKPYRQPRDVHGDPLDNK
jgi:hypothetical protein